MRKRKFAEYAATDHSRHPYAKRILDRLQKTTSGTITSLKGPTALYMYHCMKDCLVFRDTNGKTYPWFENYLEIDGSDVQDIKQELLERALVRTYKGKRTCIIFVMCEDKLSAQQVQYIRQNIAPTVPVLFVQDSSMFLPRFFHLETEMQIFKCGISKSTYITKHLQQKNIKHLRNMYKSPHILNTFSMVQTQLSTIEDISVLDTFTDSETKDFLLDKLIQDHGKIDITEMTSLARLKSKAIKNRTTLNVVQQTMGLNDSCNYGLSVMSTINRLDYAVFNASQSSDFNTAFGLFVPYRDAPSIDMLYVMNERCRSFSNIRIQNN
jgi:hypothetical protein